MIIDSEDWTRRLDRGRSVEYQAALAYAEQAEQRAQTEPDPLVRSLLLGVAMGQTVTEMARKLGLARKTAADMLHRAMR